MAEDRSWMYTDWENGRPNINWFRKTKEFLSIAFPGPNSNQMLSSCPCRTCGNYKKQDLQTVSGHLVKNGFTPEYLVWTSHGEARPSVRPRQHEEVDESHHMSDMLEDIRDAHEASEYTNASIAADVVHGGVSMQDMESFEGSEIPPVTNPHVQMNMGKYRDAYQEKHGPDVNWMHVNFDAQLMYQNTGGKPHGRYVLLDGAFDDRNVRLTSAPFGTASNASSTRQSDEELRRELASVRDENQDMRNAMHTGFTAMAQWMQDYALATSSGNPPPPPPVLNFNFNTFSTPQHQPRQEDTQNSHHAINIGQSSRNSPGDALSGEGNVGIPNHEINWFASPEDEETRD